MSESPVPPSAYAPQAPPEPVPEPVAPHAPDDMLAEILGPAREGPVADPVRVSLVVVGFPLYDRVVEAEEVEEVARVVSYYLPPKIVKGRLMHLFAVPVPARGEEAPQVESTLLHSLHTTGRSE